MHINKGCWRGFTCRLHSCILHQVNSLTQPVVTNKWHKLNFKFQIAWRVRHPSNHLVFACIYGGGVPTTAAACSSASHWRCTKSHGARGSCTSGGIYWSVAWLDNWRDHANICTACLGIIEAQSGTLLNVSWRRNWMAKGLQTRLMDPVRQNSFSTAPWALVEMLQDLICYPSTVCLIHILRQEYSSL